jgi:iduronate 2-sulfatase
VQAPTCGASRFALLTGLFPEKPKQCHNGSLAIHDHAAQPTFPAWLKQHGYTTVAVGKVSHYPGGNAGKNWNDPAKEEIPNAWTRNINPSGEWKHPQGLMHGYANGKARIPGKSPIIEAVADARYPDDAIMDHFLREIDHLTKKKKPWLLAVGLLRPHLPFACEKKYLDLYDDKKIPNYSTPKPAKGEMWHGSGEFKGNYKPAKDPNKDAAYAELVTKHYAACVSSTDKHIGTIMKTLSNKGLDNNTIVILWGDHGWHLGEKQIWGKHTLYHDSLHAPLFIKAPNGKQPGIATDKIVNSVDIYPTLCHLTGIPKPKHIQGSNLFNLLKDYQARGYEKATSYWAGKRSVITPTEHMIYDMKTDKLLQHYNLEKDPKELNNLIKK